MTDMEKVLQALEHCDLCSDMPNCPGCAYLREPDCMEHLKRDIIALLKAQEPVKPILARGWYWCGGVGCRNSLTSALDDDSPARKPNYCEKCGRPVKWDE